MASFLLQRVGTPIHFYDRFYLKEYGINEETLKNELEDRKLLDSFFGKDDFYKRQPLTQQS